MSANNAKVPRRFPTSARDKLPLRMVDKSIIMSLQGVSFRPFESKLGWPPLVLRLLHLPLFPPSTQSRISGHPRGERRKLPKLRSQSKPKKKRHRPRKRQRQRKKLRRKP